MPYKTYIRHASGDTAILFIHGILGSPMHFERFIDAVSADYGIYNILLEGHGGSVRNFSKASMEKWKKQVDEAATVLLSRYDKIFIVGHSMGTFFAMDTAVKYSKRVKGILLLQSPLKIGVKPIAVKYSMQVLFGQIKEDDEFMKEYKNANSIDLNLRFWEYIGWIPRYLELFAESKRARQTITKIDVPCVVFQSAKDELVSMKSTGFVPNKPNIKLTVLKNSTHFIYEKSEYSEIIATFCKMI